MDPDDYFNDGPSRNEYDSDGNPLDTNGDPILSRPCANCTCNTAPINAACRECGHINRMSRFGEK